MVFESSRWARRSRSPRVPGERANGPRQRRWPQAEETASHSASQRCLLPGQSGGLLFLIVGGRKGRPRVTSCGKATCTLEGRSQVDRLRVGPSWGSAGQGSTGRERGQAGCEVGSRVLRNRAWPCRCAHRHPDAGAVVSAAWHRRRLWVLSSPCEDRACGRLRKTAEKPTGLDLYEKCQLGLTGILP